MQPILHSPHVMMALIPPQLHTVVQSYIMSLLILCMLCCNPRPAPISLCCSCHHSCIQTSTGILPCSRLASPPANRTTESVYCSLKASTLSKHLLSASSKQAPALSTRPRCRTTAITIAIQQLASLLYSCKRCYSARIRHSPNTINSAYGTRYPDTVNLHY